MDKNDSFLNASIEYCVRRVKGRVSRHTILKHTRAGWTGPQIIAAVFKRRATEDARVVLKAISTKRLREMCYKDHVLFYGVNGYHLLNASRKALLDWWTTHYDWDKETQVWTYRIDML